MLNFSPINVQSIIKEIPTEGHSPLLVIGEDFNKYIIKNSRAQSPLYLLNESFASFFLDLWGIPTPDGGYVKLSTNLLEQGNYSSYHKKHYYESPAFSSKVVDRIIDINDLLFSNTKKSFNTIFNPVDFLHISLFDTWVENDDRKPTNYNLIADNIKGKHRIIAIDHAYIFSSINYSHLDPCSYSPIANDHLLISSLGRLVKKHIKIDVNFLASEQQYFYLCVERSKKEFDDFSRKLSLVYQIDSNSMQKLKSYIFNKERNKKVFDEYVYRLNQ